jgi:hypothetical protein
MDDHFPERQKKVLKSPVVHDRDPKYVPPGVYAAKCIDFFEDESKAGNPMWVLDFAITAGAHEGKELRLWLALTDNAMWKLNDVMAGMMIEKGADMTYNADVDTIMAMKLRIVVEDNDYKGQTKSAVEGVYADNNPDAPELSEDAPEAYDPNGSRPSDDDVPF